jgi:hypothetical protein
MGHTFDSHLKYYVSYLLLVANSSNSPRELPTVNSFGDPPFGIREIAIRKFAVRASTVHKQLQTPNPDSQQSTLSCIGDSPYREIGNGDVMFHCPFQSPNPELRIDATCLPLCLVVPHYHITLPLVRSGIAGSRFQLSRVLCLGKSECRNPDDTCQQPRYHCGTRRNSGLCWSFVIPSTWKRRSAESRLPGISRHLSRF